MGPCSNTLDWVPGVFGLCLSTERRLGVQQWKDSVMLNQCDQSASPEIHSVLHRFVGGEVGSELVFKEHHCRFNNQILTTVCNGQLCLAFEPAWFSYSCCQKELKYQFSVFFSFVFNGFSRPCAKIQFWKQLRIMITNQYNLALVVWSFQKPVMAAAAKGV